MHPQHEKEERRVGGILCPVQLVINLPFPVPFQVLHLSKDWEFLFFWEFFERCWRERDGQVVIAVGYRNSHAAIDSLETLTCAWRLHSSLTPAQPGTVFPFICILLTAYRPHLQRLRVAQEGFNRSSALQSWVCEPWRRKCIIWYLVPLAPFLSWRCNRNTR
jgi:hypothetical protein